MSSFNEDPTMYVLFTRNPNFQLLQVVCTSPRSSASGSVTVSVTTNGADFTEDPALFRYTPSPVVTAIEPSQLSFDHHRHYHTRVATGGGDAVRTLLVSGANCLDSARLMCHFGNVSKFVRARWLSSSLVSCAVPVDDRSAPARDRGHELQVSVTNNGVDLSPSSATLTIAPTAVPNPGRVDTGELITPGFGPVSGGTRVAVQLSGMAGLVVTKDMNSNSSTQHFFVEGGQSLAHMACRFGGTQLVAVRDQGVEMCLVLKRLSRTRFDRKGRNPLFETNGSMVIENQSNGSLLTPC